MSKIRVFPVLVLALVLGWTAGCKSNKQADPASTSAGAGAPVKVEPVVRQKVAEKLTYTGAVEAWRTVTISPETGGKIARIYVEEGQRVGQGQLLAEMDTQTIGLQVKQAEAAIAVAEAGFQNAARNKERMDRLLAEKAISDSQYEQTKLAYDAGKAQLDQARAALNLARHAYDVSYMKAPWSGVIASKNAEVGDIINPMMGGYGTAGGVLTLVDDSRIKIVVEASQNDVGRLSKGLKTSIRANDREAAGLPGVVSVVNPTADPLSKKFRVEISAENPGRVLRPGTFGSVEFEITSHENTLAVPQKSVFENKYVYVVEGGKAVRRSVALGLKNTTMIEVLDGLKEGDQVIVEGAFGLADGTAVEIRK